MNLHSELHRKLKNVSGGWRRMLTDWTMYQYKVMNPFTSHL